jgi:acyl-coenzyme A synthetase/AMP-(fatty) acid ligase
MDSQIKLGGNRIELGEIENVVKNIAGVENACVLFDGDKQEIVAFLQTQADITLNKMKRLLLQQIPRYMVPSRLIITEKLPLTPNGKIDRVKIRTEYKA